MCPNPAYAPVGPKAAHPAPGGNVPPKLPAQPKSPPKPFDAAHDPVVDGAKWAKEVLFSTRAFGRLPLDGFVGSKAPPGTVPKGPAFLENNRVGQIAKTTDKIADLKDLLVKQTGLHVPGYEKVSPKPVIVPGAPQPAAESKPIVKPGQTTPSGKALIVPGQGQPSGKPLVLPGEGQPSGKPLILPNQAQPIPGKPITIPGEAPATGKLVAPQIAEAEAKLANLGKLANATKYVGLGGFSIAANIQKGAEINGYLRSGNDGDKWRAGASSAEFLNNARLGLVGITPLFKVDSTIAKFSQSYAGGIFGRNLGVGANVAAGGLRIGGALQDAQTETKAATTQRGRDIAWNKAEQSIIGTTLDTANDVYPYLSAAEPLAWASWLSGKLTDHAATTMLAGSGYQPKSLGATHARNLMPLLSTVGLAKDVPLRDLSQPMSADQKLVAKFDNTINKAAGVGAGATDVVVTTATVAGTAYVTGGYPGAVYAGLQVEHMARQGLNIWSDRYWQRPDERMQAIEKAGLDPKLDTRKVVTEQPDFVHRLWANATVNFTAGYIDRKDDFGRASKDEQRWLALDDKYSSKSIKDDTRRESQAWYDQMLSPENVGKALTYTLPGEPVLAKALDSRNIGAAAATVEEGWHMTGKAASEGWNWILERVRKQGRF